MKIDGVVHIYGALGLTEINSGTMNGRFEESLGRYVVIYGLKVVGSLFYF